MSAPAAELHALVLAAGASKRFGAIKQLARIEGEALVLRVARRAAAALEHTWVILGAHADALAPLLSREPVRTCVNAHWSEGMASSIRTGLAAVPPACTGVMLILGDQAGITVDEYRQLAERWRGRPAAIAAAHCGERIGPPVIFPRRLFPELLRLRGDTGARAVLRQHADEVLEVAMPSAAFDLDTPQDLAAYFPAAPR